MYVSLTHGRRNAFIRADLIAIVCVVLLLSFLGTPLWGRVRTSRAALRCMNNLRHLTIAWHQYAGDHKGRLVHNVHGTDAAAGAGVSRRFAPWASGWQTWGTDSDNTNALFIRSEPYAKLSPYLTVAHNVHKCPSDVYLTRAQRTKGWKERVRSVAMNGTLGHANLQGNPGPANLQMYSFVLKLSDLSFPSPSETSVFLDEHPDSINDPFFWPPNRTTWIDVPANFHSGGVNVSFADGHVESHLWQGPTRTYGVRFSFGGSALRLGDPDLSWISYHSQRRNEMHY